MPLGTWVVGWTLLIVLGVSLLGAGVARVSPSAQVASRVFGCLAVILLSAVVVTAVDDVNLPAWKAELDASFPMDVYRDMGDRLPRDEAPLVECASKAQRVLIVEESQASFGWGAEVAARIQEKLGASAPRISRLGAAPTVIPASKPLEDQVLVTERHVEERLIALLQEQMSAATSTGFGR